MADEIINNQETVEVEKTEKDAKVSKSTSKKGPGLGKRVGKFFRDTKGEFKKVIWPTFPAVVRNTGVTLAMCVLLGLIICAVDIGLSALINLMVEA